MDRQTRKDLKTDKFALEMSHGYDWVTEHKEKAMQYGGIALAVLVIGFGTYFYRAHQATVREAALVQALKIDDATIGSQAPNPEGLHFDTIDQKQAARTKAYTELAAKYHGTQEGAIAAIYLAADLADKGDLVPAQKAFQDIVDSAPKPYAALARLSLAEVYSAEGNTDEAEKVLRTAVANPTVTVSKDEATIELAKVIAKKNPAEARTMLDPLQTSQRGAVSRAAITAMSQLPPAPPGSAKPAVAK